jgi:hypothetical protein
MGRKLLSKWLASVAIACAATSLTGPVHAKDLTFGYLPNSMEYPYDVATVTGFQDEAKKAGVKTIVLDPRSSVEKQGNQLDDLLAQGVDAIGIMPQDSVVAEGWVDKIAERHIPIVAIAVPVGDPAKHPADYVYPKLTALVTTDDVEGGAVSGRLAAQMLPKDRVAKIAIVEGMPGFAVVPQREQGFEGALKKAGVKFEIVASDLPECAHGASRRRSVLQPCRRYGARLRESDQGRGLEGEADRHLRRLEARQQRDRRWRVRRLRLCSSRTARTPDVQGAQRSREEPERAEGAVHHLRHADDHQGHTEGLSAGVVSAPPRKTCRWRGR